MRVELGGGDRVYSPKEQEIMTRCLSISIWNQKAEKLIAAGNLAEGHLTRRRVLTEINALDDCFKEYHRNILSPDYKPTKRGIFQRIFGKKRRAT
jgi:hypothetical protein